MKRQENQVLEGAYFCKKCGEPNQGSVDYSEMSFGTASIVQLEEEGSWAEYDNYEVYQTEDFSENTWRCDVCHSEGSNQEDIFTTDIKEVWKLLYGKNYPEMHYEEGPVPSCECWTCREGRIKQQLYKSQSKKRRRKK